MSNTQSYAVTEAMSNLINQQPFIAVLLMELLQVRETTDVPIAATDSKYIYINPDKFAEFTLQERVFIIAHEVLHVVYQHMERGKQYQDRGIGPDFKVYSHNKMNRAADYVINGTLANSNIGTMPLIGLHNPNIDENDSADEVYCKLPDEDDDPNGPGSGTGGESGGFDKHMPPDPTAPGNNKATVQRALASAVNTAKMQGNLAAGLARMAGEIIDPKEDWRAILRDFMITTSGRDEPSWRRLNRRRLVTPPHVAFPGTQGHKCGKVAIVIDTSGSIGDDELRLFMGEVNGILQDAQPEECKVFWTDSEVAGIDDVDEDTDLTTLESKGGGGTDMPAAYPVIEEHFPEGISCMICLTDGYTGYDTEPSWPTLWAMTTDKVAPYGTTIRLDD